MNLNNIILRQLLVLLALSCLLGISVTAHAQHKGITFQAVLKDPDGNAPTASGLTVTLQILDPVNNCVLREEEHSGINISNGYMNLVIGDSAATTPAATNPNPVLSIKQVLDNSKVINGFGCVYTPDPNHARKLRVKVNVPRSGGGTDLVIADFNMRSAAFAVNSEMLNGKSDTDLVNVNSAQGVTQANVESIFNRFTKLDAILNNFNAGGTSIGANITGNAATATTAVNVSGTVAIANGGTGATTAATARTNLGLGPLATLSPTGTADNTTYLRGDGTWATVSGGSGTVTSVTAAGTAGNPITIAGTASAPTVDLPAATSGQNGYLKSADWTTFNNKQAGSSELNAIAGLALTGILQRTGSGTYTALGTSSPLSVVAGNITLGTVPVANGGTGSTDGSITGTGALTFAAGGSNQNITLTPSGTGSTVLNGNVGIGTASPSEALEVSGNIKATQVCIGTDCRASWPASGGASATMITNWPDAVVCSYANGVKQTLFSSNNSPTGALYEDPFTDGGAGRKYIEYDGAGNYVSQYSMTGADCIGQSIAQLYSLGRAFNLVGGNGATQWTTAGSNIWYNTGNVGIGTTSPGQKLSVAGTIESTSGGIKFPDGTTQTTASSGGVSGTIIEPKCGSTYTGSSSYDNCTPPTCPAGWTDLGVINDVYMDIQNNTGYRSRYCQHTTSYLVIEPKCKYSDTNNNIYYNCTPPSCPSGWTDLNVTSTVFNALGGSYGYIGSRSRYCVK